MNYGVKAGGTYKLSGRHFVTVNATYLTRKPEATNMFISQTVRNDVVSGIKAEEVISADVNYIIRYPGLKFRLTYYNTQINNQTWLRGFITICIITT
ncbi:MAG: hypothetical protein IPJ32_10695 [Sphingobacteriaceae bacterium]|nr:hypothetical protein [Sphingobacteriaceae bacterium]